MAVASCKVCSKSFNAKPSWIKKGDGKYCSRQCSDKGRRTGKMIFCFLCSKETYKPKKLFSRSERHFCSKKCSVTWHNAEFSKEKHGNWRHGTFAYRRILERAGVFPRCALCNLTDKDILLVHHIDKDRKNNKLRNLVWLCHNCHHLVHNYSDVGRLSYLKIKSHA